MKKISTRQLKEINQAIRPSEFVEYRAYLKTLFAEYQLYETGFTYTQFGQMMGYKTHNMIRHILKGRRDLTTKAALKIADFLKITAFEKKYLIALCSYENAKSSEKRASALRVLSTLKRVSIPQTVIKEYFEIYQEWYYTVIREMVNRPDFKNDPAWISQQLTPSIRPKQAENAIELLRKLNLISWDQNSERLVKTDAHITTPQSVTDLIVIQLHETFANLGKDSITRYGPEEREVRATTIRLDQAGLNEISQKMNELHDLLFKLEEKAPTGEFIMQVNSQIFPVCRPIPKEISRKTS